MIAANSGVDASRLDAMDEAAFIALVEPVLPTAYRLAVAMLRSEVEAEDVVQEAVYKAWRSRSRFRADAAMQPWLLTIVANQCRAVRRNRWWSVLRGHADIPAVAGRVERDAESDADTAGLRRALAALPHDQRLAVVLRFYLDLGFDDVARVMKTSTKAAKSRTYRALERLRLDPEVSRDEDG